MAVTPYVADACALIAHLNGEKGGDTVRDLLSDPDARVFAHALNLCEVYYDVIRSDGHALADHAIVELVADGLTISEDMDQALWKDAASLKVSPGNLSLADCVAIAFARRKNCELLTTDHREMNPVVPLNIVKIKFIR
jgi:PIN domain nuclease of toxin-antitoxin system